MRLTHQTIKNIYFGYIFIFWIGGATFLVAKDSFLVLTFLLSFVLYFGSKAKRGVHPRFLFLSVYFVCVSLISIKIHGKGVEYNVLVGYVMRLSIAYFSISYLGWPFLNQYRKAIYIISIISVPLYFIQVFDPNFYIQHLSSINMSDEIRRSVDYWNFFIYTAHQGTYLEIIRNSGFAIEPSHFGFLLGFGIILELIKSEFILNKRIVVLILIGLTTFSTTYYVFLAFLMLFYQSRTKRKTNFFLLRFCAVLSSVFLLISSNVVEDKIVKTVQLNQIILESSPSRFKDGRILNRLGMIQIGIKNILRNPLGHGLNSDGLVKNVFGDVLVGPNSFIKLTMTWGIIFPILLPVVLYRFFRYCIPEATRYDFLLFMIIFLLWLNTSIQSRDILFFMIFFIGFLKIKPHAPVKTLLKD